MLRLLRHKRLTKSYRDITLVGIPITNTSVNPARSTGPALFVGGWALSQLWLFWVAPIIGGVIGALAYQAFSNAGPEEQGQEPEAFELPGD